MPFEAALAELEQIVDQLEKGAVALDGLDEKGPDWLLEKVATHHFVWL